MQDVDEEVLDLVPGVDGVRTVQNDHDVHERLTPCQIKNKMGSGRDVRSTGWMDGWMEVWWLLCRAGAMVCDSLKLRPTLEQIPVLYRELPHS